MSVTTHGKRSVEYLKIAATLSAVESAKRLAAHRAVDDHFPADASVIGIGSGSTVTYAVERILQRKNTEGVVFVSTGFQSRNLILGGGLRLGGIDAYPSIDVAFDGADEVDAQLNLIKGGGACLFQEKLVAGCAKKFIIIADSRKKSCVLGTTWDRGVPVEVDPLAHAKVTRDLLELGATSASLRMGLPAKAGPVITDNGNFILDAKFGEMREPQLLGMKIKLMVGVLEVGLFVSMAQSAYFGNEDGSVTIRREGKDTDVDESMITSEE